MISSASATMLDDFGQRVHGIDRVGIRAEHQYTPIRPEEKS
jgi:hypothetical protein